MECDSSNLDLRVNEDEGFALNDGGPLPFLVGDLFQIAPCGFVIIDVVLKKAKC